MFELVFDAEANGWRDEADTVWCICIIPLKGSVEEYDPDRLHQGLERLSEADHLIGHNIIDYDLPLLERLYGWKPKPGTKITDTLVRSRLQRPDRPLPHGCPGNLGPHSLAAWGYRVGRGKPEHSDWSKYTPAMLHRCSEDVEINLLTLHALDREAEAIPVDWTDSTRTEHAIAPIITEQEQFGVPLDLPLLWSTRTELRNKIRKIDEELVPIIPEVALPKSKQGTWPKQQYKKDGTPTVNALRYYGPDFGRDKEYRTDLIVRTAPINLKSDKQVKEYLMSIGWQPNEWNYKKGKDGKPVRDMNGQRIKTSPRLTLDSLESCQWPDEHADMGQKIHERLMMAHRLSTYCNGWLRDVRADGRISAKAIPMGTPTGRMIHRGVVNVPGKGAGYGHELRSCCTTIPGYDRVGIDLVSCQIYGLAHYMEDEEFRYQVVEGDHHQYAADLAGLADRQAGKKFNYSILFGASDEKLASDLGITKKQAAEARARYFKALPRLDALIKKLEREWKQHGYIVGLDGRPIWTRARHMLLVYLLQTLESVVIKNFIIGVYHRAKETGLDYHLVTTMHDECQWLVKKEHVGLFKMISAEVIEKVNVKFNLWCPQAIDVNVGSTWAECH